MDEREIDMDNSNIIISNQNGYKSNSICDCLNNQVKPLLCASFFPLTKWMYSTLSLFSIKSFVKLEIPLIIPGQHQSKEM